MSQFEKLQKAAALKYSDSSPDSAPVVVASGLGYVAQQIVDIAAQNDVPVFRDDSLATLLSQLHAGTEIPPELYRAVVDIYVYFLGYAPKASPGAESASSVPSGPTPEGQEKNG